MASNDGPENEVVKGAVYGVVNGLMVLPVMISFAAIIYRDPAFQPFLPTLVKLTIFSAGIHQIAFALFSSMAFAVGQVQDAGLIFLAAMAGTIVTFCNDAGADSDTMISTTVVLLSSATLCLGLALMLVGRLKLASCVQYLPMPVVGGYLAFIGLFCGESGFAMMGGVEVAGVNEWYKFADPHVLTLITPGFVLGLGLYWAVRNCRHMLTLPGCMGAIILGFYATLYFTGTSLDEARELGWVATASADSSASAAWKYFRFGKVLWGAAPRIFVNWIAMFFVVAFSSSLDVAAIEMELGTPLDYNQELMTVGISNFCSGLSGGYTGSYIFSQTIFNLRVGVRSRITGFIIAGIEMVVFALPFSVVAYVPKCFFGSLLTLICVDLCYEWLIEARHKMAATEYFVCIATFVAVNIMGVEGGMLVGIVLAMATFTFGYARLPTVKTNIKRNSLTTRTFQERIILDKATHEGQMQIFQLQGYIFFGSAVNLLADVKERVRLPDRNIGSVRPTQSFRPLRQRDRSYSSPNLDAAVDPKNVHAQTEVAAMPVYNRGGNLHYEEGGSPNLRRMRSNSFGSPQRALKQQNMLIPGGSPTTNVAPMPIYNRGGGQPLSNRTSPSGSGVRGRNRSYSFGTMKESTPLLSSGALGEAQGFTHSREVSEDSSPIFSPMQLGLDLMGLGRRQGSEASRSRTESGSTAMGSPNPKRAIMDLESGIPEMEVSAVNGFSHKSSMGDDDGIGIKSWVILDFEKVSGVDATAARACFLVLRKLLQKSGVQLVYAAVPDHVMLLLNAHGVIDEAEDPLFDTLEEALEWCEERLLALSEGDSGSSSHMPGHLRKAKSSVPDLTAYKNKVQGRRLRRLRKRLSQDDPWEPLKTREEDEPEDASLNVIAIEGAAPELEGHPSSDELFLSGKDASWKDLRVLLYEYINEGSDGEVGRVMKNLRSELNETMLKKYFEVKIVEEGITLFQRGEASSCLYILRQGEVELLMCDDAGTGDGVAVKERRIQKISDGGVAGEVGFFLCRPQDFRAVSRTHCQMWYMTRESLAKMCQKNPTLAMLLQHAILRSLSLSISEGLLM
uniref:STAS domain-containing protein n=1 Tax=Phaeomonas parva TaxID=124430 RepID=A0A7S1UB31_9STRA